MRGLDERDFRINGILRGHQVNIRISWSPLDFRITVPYLKSDPDYAESAARKTSAILQANSALLPEQPRRTFGT